MHLDGARIFNASVATGIKLSEYAKYFDTLTFCLSKGLGAPVGSLVCASKKLIEGRIHRARKMLGGGMRQAGILAAAGIYALENNIERIKEDHENARQIAETISGNDVFSLNPKDIETNIVIFSISDENKAHITAPQVCEHFAKEGVFFSPLNKTSMRIVTHLDIVGEDIKTAIEKIKEFRV